MSTTKVFRWFYAACGLMSKEKVSLKRIMEILEENLFLAIQDKKKINGFSLRSVVHA